MFAEAGLTLSCSFSEQPVLSFSAGALRAMWQAETCRFQDGHRGWGPWHQFRFARSSSKPFSPFCSRCHVIVCVHRPCQVTFSRRAMTSPESSTPIRRLLRDRWSTARVMSLKLQLLRVRCVGISLCLFFLSLFCCCRWVSSVFVSFSRDHRHTGWPRRPRCSKLSTPHSLADIPIHRRPRRFCNPDVASSPQTGRRLPQQSEQQPESPVYRQDLHRTLPAWRWAAVSW